MDNDNKGSQALTILFFACIELREEILTHEITEKERRFLNALASLEQAYLEDKNGK